jgi:selenide, water dikinase
MQVSSQPVLRDIVLVGGGHSHVGVLKSFGMNPIPGVRLTLICTDMHTPYSGMLPGYVAGHYSYDDVYIDLSRLAVFANARVYRAQVNGVDLPNKKVLCVGRPPVPYDFLSINIGSTPQLAQVPGAAQFAVPVKPIQQFNDRWLALLEQVSQHEGPVSIAVVGAGAGGVELTLAMQYRLINELTALGKNPANLHFHLLTNSHTILPTHNKAVQTQFSRVLKNRGITVYCDSAVVEVAPGRIKTAGDQWIAADAVMWVTRAGGADWLKKTGLALDADGFIQVNDSLQSLTDPAVFAAGDVATMVERPLEKAGVFAVRQAKPLTHNLRCSVLGRPLISYRPQRSWLALISTGDQYAVASRGPIGFWGAWVWRWKDRIDRRFMQKYSVFPEMNASSEKATDQPTQLAGQLTSQESLQAISAIAMRCGGCGAKVGASVLSRALSQLEPFDSSDVVIGLKDPDDAAVVLVPPGKAMVHSVDFFRSFIDDPYVFGKVAANHALGDIWAMGAQAQSATAIATVPPGLEAKVEDVLFQMMTGAIEVLNEAGCALVGGHTGEGQELALGFAVNGLIDSDPSKIMRKGSMRSGDVLILTKPIGTGTLFAAHARMKAKGRWISAALTSMILSNRLGAQCLQQFGVTACTDLTGFGLLGHLVEMTRPSNVDAQLSMSALPLLDGAQDCVAGGIVSSLQDSNVRLRRALRNQEAYVNHPRYPLIFDPQTAGGLLAAVAADKAEDCVRVLRELGYVHTAIIGKIMAQSSELEPIVLVE